MYLVGNLLVAEIETPRLAPAHPEHEPQYFQPDRAQCAVAEKLARQKKIDTATVDDVIAEVQNPELRALLAKVRLSVDSANPLSGQTETL